MIKQSQRQLLTLIGWEMISKVGPKLVAQHFLEEEKTQESSSPESPCLGLCPSSDETIE